MLEAPYNASIFFWQFSRHIFFLKNCRLWGAFTYYLITLLKSQTDFCSRRPTLSVVAIGQIFLEGTEESIRDRRPPQFVVAGGHNVLEITEMIAWYRNDALVIYFNMWALLSPGFLDTSASKFLKRCLLYLVWYGYVLTKKIRTKFV